MSEMIWRMSWSCLRSSPCLKITGYMAPSSALKISLAGIRALWRTRRGKRWISIEQSESERMQNQTGDLNIPLDSARRRERERATLKSVAVSGTMPLILICGSRGRGIGSISERFTFSLSASRACSRSVCGHRGRRHCHRNSPVKITCATC